MSLHQLLMQTHHVAAQWESSALSPFLPGWVIFFSASNGKRRAHIVCGRGQSFDEAWQNGVLALQHLRGIVDAEIIWLRVDIVERVEKRRWGKLQEKLTATKRNYFRFGLSFDPCLIMPSWNKKLPPTPCCMTGRKMSRRPIVKT